MSSTELWGLVGVVILIFSVILLMKDLARPTSGPSLQERARQIEQERQIDLACAKLRAETVQNIIRAAMATASVREPRRKVARTTAARRLSVGLWRPWRSSTQGLEVRTSNTGAMAACSVPKTPKRP